MVSGNSSLSATRIEESPISTQEDIARLFIGFAVPEHVKDILKKSVRAHYRDALEQMIPHERWHITLAFLGDISDPNSFYSTLSKPLFQTHVPVVKITHIGQGLQKQQLWAYINATPALAQVREDIVQRVESVGLSFSDEEKERQFQPHIRLANLVLDTVGSFGVVDTACSVSFPVKEANIYRSYQSEGGVRYTVESSIILSP